MKKPKPAKTTAELAKLYKYIKPPWIKKCDVFNAGARRGKCFLVCRASFHWNWAKLEANLSSNIKRPGLNSRSISLAWGQQTRWIKYRETHIIGFVCYNRTLLKENISLNLFKDKVNFQECRCRKNKNQADAAHRCSQVDERCNGWSDVLYSPAHIESDLNPHCRLLEQTLPFSVHSSLNFVSVCFYFCTSTVCLSGPAIGEPSITLTTLPA